MNKYSDLDLANQLRSDQYLLKKKEKRKEKKLQH